MREVEKTLGKVLEGESEETTARNNENEVEWKSEIIASFIFAELQYAMEEWKIFFFFQHYLVSHR